jgi:type IV pilus assembly protein PilM
MFSFVQSIFAPPAHPIGIDFGTDTLRLAQVQAEGDDFQLLAAASADFPGTDSPAGPREDPAARLQFFAETVRNLITSGKFQGRSTVLGLPSSIVHTQHVTIDAIEEDKIKEAALAIVKDSLPFDPSRALIRHAVAGQPRDGQGRHRLVVMAADLDWVNQYIAAARKARVDVVAMNMQPIALLDCFASIYRRTSEQKSVRMYVDIGSSGTRAVIGQGVKLLYFRNIPVGGEQITAAVADALGISAANARTMRLKCGTGSSDQADRVDAAARSAFDRLARELQTCREEHEDAFPELPVERLIFVGGEARLKALCDQVSEQLKIPGQIGDSLCRMVRNSRIGIESAIDRRCPQPAWAAAIGLSMGPPIPSKTRQSPARAGR